MRSFPRRDIDPKNGYSMSTINLVMKVIKKALKEAVRLQILPRDPSASIEMLSEDTETRGILTPDEIEKLFQLEWSDKRSKTASILGAVSGMRLSEVIGLRIECINADKNVILVERSYSHYEKRLKGTKNEKSRFIYTDSSIIKMLTELHDTNPYHDSYIFYGLTPNTPMRHDTVEEHLEKMLAQLLGTEVIQSIDENWKNLAKIVADNVKVAENEWIAIQDTNIDSDQNCLVFRYAYAHGPKKIEMKKYEEKQIIPIDKIILKKLVVICNNNPNGFILSGVERETPIDFDSLDSKSAQKRVMAYGEIARRERNISFHSFRHFFNSTIRGTVSDDILRSQTGHTGEEMTDLYDHMTDDRGNQLRKAVQMKILPFIKRTASC